MNINSHVNIAILVTPYESQAIYAISRKIISICSYLANSVYFICGNIPDSMSFPRNVQAIDVNAYLHYVKKKNPTWLSAISWIIKLIYIQIRMGVEIIRHRDSIDIVFCILGIYYQVPIIVARLLGKKVIIGAFGLDHQNAKVVYRKIIVASILEVLMNISYSFTHFIVIESWKLGEEDILARRKSKLRYGAYFSGDTNLFKLIIPIEARPNFIGYFGRFSIEKGTIDFIKAIPLILIKIPNLKVLLVGGGMLDEEVEALINSLGLKSNVELAGWIDYTKLQDYYNKVKLVVIPSKCEGLPNVLLEAVSCGTPVLATPVGGIPDIIIEGETGFILENPSPEEIARKVIYILEDMDRLKRVSLKAKKLVNEQYSFDASITRYAGIIRDLYSAN